MNKRREKRISEFNRMQRFFRQFGPGIVTGAADDDPSGISTYSVTGAQFGLGLLWTVLFTFPLMAAVQSMCARLGLVSENGLAAAIRQFYPRWVLWVACALLLVANVVNIAADLAGMAEALELVSGLNRHIWLPIVAVLIVSAMIWWSYLRLAKVFKWLTLVLASYLIAAFLAKPQWGSVLKATFVPEIQFNSAYLMTLVGILGTTITPYMFFWQSAQEVEELREQGQLHRQHRGKFMRGRLLMAEVDVVAGMGWAGIVMYFIILTCATTLHRPGMPPIETAQQAAVALRPVAGDAAYWLFTLGLVGTGVLAIPVLAGSAAYAISEALHWDASLNDRPEVAPKFYGVIVTSVLLGLALGFMKIAAMKALFLAAVVNGVLAPPLVAMVTLLTSREDVMGKYVSPPWMRNLGWITVVLMSLASLGFLFAGR